MKDACLVNAEFSHPRSNLVLGMCNTAIFISVVRSAVLLHDVSARAGDESMEIAVFPTGEILLLSFEKSSDD